MPRADIEKCLSIAFEKNLCLDREEMLKEVISLQEEEANLYELRLKNSEEILELEKERLNNKIRIEKNKKSRNLLLGLGTGAITGFVLGILIAN